MVVWLFAAGDGAGVRTGLLIRPRSLYLPASALNPAAGYRLIGRLRLSVIRRSRFVLRFSGPARKTIGIAWDAGTQVPIGMGRPGAFLVLFCRKKSVRRFA